MYVNDPERMTAVITCDLQRNEQDCELKRLQQAVLHLYKLVDNLRAENRSHRNKIEDLEHR